MEQHISEFIPHAQEYTSKVKDLTLALAEHTKAVQAAASASAEEARIHRDMTEKAYKTRIQEEKNLSEIRQTAEKEKKAHEDKIHELEVFISRRTKDASELEDKCKILDIRANTLISEIKGYTRRLEEIAPQVSTIERAVSSLKIEQEQVSKSIESLKEEEASIKTSIESERKALVRIQEDIKIVNSR